MSKYIVSFDRHWRMADGGWRMAHGAWRMAHGGWPMADGGWQMADGGRDSGSRSPITKLNTDLFKKRFIVHLPYDEYCKAV